ncbi:histidine phosphatase family protein [Comamonas serinivorans]|uniref:Histidine phosphatase family protein n=1 Tax=Comamonas serinivorans TaxID=1082851 RepID=A0A1Y0ETD1_9BURK|nr:histidine phosphatase family protein [Comamonas serinivorans]ARU06927.1 histidine phosphatase family protein [Comamonas serinivorans]
MDATRIILIRHGETAWNASTRIQGHTDIGLNARGLLQAQLVAQALAQREPLAAIVSSDLSRARQTAQATGDATGVAVQVDAQWRERAFGRFEGERFDDILARWPEEAQRWRTREPDWQAPDGGESLVQLRARIAQALNTLAARHAGQLIAIFTHGGVIDVVHRLARGLDLQAPRSWQLANAAIHRLLWTPDSLHIVGWDDQQHLQHPQLMESLDERSA